MMLKGVAIESQLIWYNEVLMAFGAWRAFTDMLPSSNTIGAGHHSRLTATPRCSPLGPIIAMPTLVALSFRRHTALREDESASRLLETGVRSTPWLAGFIGRIADNPAASDTEGGRSEKDDQHASLRAWCDHETWAG